MLHAVLGVVSSPVGASVDHFLASHTQFIIYHFIYKFGFKLSSYIFSKIYFLCGSNDSDLHNIVQWWGFFCWSA